MQQQFINSGNTRRKKTLYEKNAMYGTNLTQSQMQEMQRRKKMQQQQIQQKKRLQQQKERQQQLQLNDISIDDLYPQSSQQRAFQMSNAMRKQKQPQLQQVYPQSQSSSSFQMSNPMRRQKQPQLQQVYPQSQSSSFQMSNPMRQRQQQKQQQRPQVQGQQRRSQQQQLKKAIQQEKQAATRKTKDTQKSLYQQKQQQQKRRQQIRTLINNLRALNPKYYWEGLGVGKGGYAPTLPIANEILFELSNRAQLNEDHIDQINDILQQKTEDDAIFKLGRSPAFGSKYRTYNDYLKSAQRRQMLQQMYV